MTLFKPSPRSAVTNVVDSSPLYTILCRYLAGRQLPFFKKPSYSVHVVWGEFIIWVHCGAHSAGYVLRMRQILQIFKVVLCANAIPVMHICIARPRPDKRRSNQAVNIGYLALPVLSQFHLSIPQGIDPSLQDATRPGHTTFVNTSQRFHPAKARDLVETLVSGNWLPDFRRGIIGAHGGCPFAVSIPRPLQRRWGNFVTACQYTTEGAGGQTPCL